MFKMENRLEELERENRELHKYNVNGSSGICRAKLLGDRYGRWHIGNIISSEKHCYMLQKIEDEGAVKDEVGRAITCRFTFTEIEPDTVQRFACMEEERNVYTREECPRRTRRCVLSLMPQLLYYGVR